MKKIFFVILFFSVIVNSSFAEYNFGVVAGTNIEKMTFEKRTIYKYHYPHGYTIGVFGEFCLSSNLLIRFELAKSHSINKFVYYTIFEDMELYEYDKHYISIPILLNFYPNDVFYIQGGIQIHYNNKVNYHYRNILLRKHLNNKTNITSDVSKYDTFFCLGVGKNFSFINKEIGIVFRLLKGMNNMEGQWFLYDKANSLQLQLIMNLQLL